MLLTDVCQKHHIITLALAHRPLPPSAKPTRCDLHNSAEKLYRPNFFPGVDKGEPHRLWPAKKIAAFFSTSLSSRTNRSSLRRRVFSFSTSSCGPDIRSLCSFSGHHFAIPCQAMDAAGPICSVSKARHPNLMIPVAAPLIDTA